MEISRFIEAFRALHTTDSRQHALDALAGELTPHEWRALHAVTGSRTFQLDLVGQLPLELVAQIFAYLDVAHPYRLQLVSRQWHHVLKSTTVLTTGLHNWYQNTVDLRNVDYASCGSMAQRIQAFRTFKPHSHFVIRLHRYARDPILAGDFVIWKPVSHRSTDFERSICVLNLTSWKFRELHGDAREGVHSIAASDELVTMATSLNVCYVWELHGRGFKKFRVPSTEYFDCITCRERTVACVGLFEDNISVYIWDFDSQRGRSFEIDRYFPKDHPLGLDSMGPGSYRGVNVEDGWMSLLLQPKSSSIIIITTTLAHASETKELAQLDESVIVSSRYTYDGVLVDRSFSPPHGQHANSRLPDLMYVQAPGPYSQLVPVDQRGRYLLPARCLPSRIQVSNFVWLEFDEHLNQFVTTGQRSGGDLTTVWWKDTFYESDRDAREDHSMLKTTVGNTSGFKRTLQTFVEHGENCPEDLSLFEESFLNENYLVRVGGYGLLVYCFDERSDRPTESGPFFNEGDFTILEYQEKEDCYTFPPGRS
ncbi:hypothetical protein T440DRAFT_421283 [Plenodomus tracheiphilus IPT5]|uniref:F-box domain-containing protein n=1 Tax=Plenodomus tracheiphilus IPT5 TaxID=1408161 RepID=A0A6A7BDC6_9PLEO|nr:hypothetical protein T440DRAFT_421283 [Plenodomus tracheiphilus IPT5]